MSCHVVAVLLHSLIPGTFLDRPFQVPTSWLQAVRSGNTLTPCCHLQPQPPSLPVSTWGENGANRDAAKDAKVCRLATTACVCGLVSSCRQVGGGRGALWFELRMVHAPQSCAWVQALMIAHTSTWLHHSRYSYAYGAGSRTRQLPAFGSVQTHRSTPAAPQLLSAPLSGAVAAAASPRR